ncbi:MAG: tripartite tricarboxylate transporter substrate binding protein [Deltaproteobacteria bacterium]|nr:tripartite tricarboxylate transporter substrate binding protein [Deltaproteobacteria bacterium]
MFGRREKGFWSFWCVLLLSLFLISTIVAGDAEARSKFPSKTITYVIPTSPGGGFDTVSRMILPYLRKYLPGNPKIIIKNAPGGEWNIGINKMYRARPDGHTIGILNMPANAVSQVLGTARFDLRKIIWLGNLAEVTYVTALSRKCKYRTLKELQNAPEVVSGVVGLASTAGLGTLIAAERMGIRMKFIPHAGSTEAILAAIRGDVDWVQYPFSTLKKSIVDSHDLIPVWVYSKKRIDLIPNMPTVAELGYGDILDVVKMYRPVGGPPGMPEDVTRIWRDAFWKATNDPEFQAKQRAANMMPLPMTHEELEAMVEGAIKMVSQYKDIILKYRK